MYLDEIVHCGLDAGIPRKYTMRETGLAWFDFHLRGILPADINGDTRQDADDIFPRACIVQVNTDTDLRLRTGQENPGFSGSNTGPTASQFPREGAVFDSIAAMPRGCTGAGADCAAIAIDTANGVDNNGLTDTAIITGPDPSQNKPAQFLPVFTATDSRVLAGLPLVDLSVTRANTAQDEIAFVGVAVQRCHANSADGDGSGTDCEGNAPQLLHFQVTPIRLFPNAAADGRLMLRDLVMSSGTFSRVGAKSKPPYHCHASTEGACSLISLFKSGEAERPLAHTAKPTRDSTRTS